MKKLAILVISLVLVIPLAVPSYAQTSKWETELTSGPLLAEISISPYTQWLNWGGPDVPVVQVYYDTNITQIEVTAVPEDPTYTMTLDGRPISSGMPATISTLGGWTHSLLVVTDAEEQSNNSYLLRVGTEGSPYQHTFVMAILGGNGGIRTIHWPPRSQITLNVNASPGGPTLFTDTQVTGTSFGTIHIVSEDSFYWDLPAMGWPVILSPGMEIVITDGTYSIAHTILPLTIDETDVDADLISGTGQPGIIFDLDVFPLEGGDDFAFDFGLESEPNRDLALPKYTVDESGNWEFDFAAEGFDLTTDHGIQVYMRLWGPHWPTDTGATCSLVFDLLNPQDQGSGSGIGVSLDMNLVAMDHIIPGVEAILTVLSEPGGEVLFTGTAQADTDGFLIWGGPAGQGSPLGIDLSPGMEISVNWGNVEQSLVLVDLSVEEIDVSLDTVSGFGSTGEEIRVVIGLWDPTAGLASFQAIAVSTETVEVGADGSWIVDLAAQGIDIMEGMAVAALSGNIMAIGYAEIDPIVELENPESSLVSDQETTVVSTTASNGASAEVTVPAAALPAGSSVNVAVITNIEDLIEQVPLPEVVDLVSGFEVNATAADGSDIREGFADSISIEFVVDASAIPEGTPPSELVIAFWNGAEWVSVETIEATENPDGSVTLTATTDHLTVFGIAHDPKGAVEVGPVNPLDEFTPNSLMSLDPMLESLAGSDNTVDSSPSGGISTITLVAIIAGSVAVLSVITGAAIYLRRRRA
ncbi:hypothetical protein ACFLVI_03600 [Chloroflexota bacterium]